MKARLATVGLFSWTRPSTTLTNWTACCNDPLSKVDEGLQIMASEQRVGQRLDSTIRQSVIDFIDSRQAAIAVVQ